MQACSPSLMRRWRSRFARDTPRKWSDRRNLTIGNTSSRARYVVGLCGINGMLMRIRLQHKAEVREERTKTQLALQEEAYKALQKETGTSSRLFTANNPFLRALGFRSSFGDFKGSYFCCWLLFPLLRSNVNRRMVELSETADDFGRCAI